MTFWKSIVSTISGEQKPAPARGSAKSLKPEDFRGPRRMKEGYLWADSLIMPRPCTIRDISPLTAQIVLWHDDIKPQLLSRPLKLFSSSDRQEADCVMVGRENNILHLRFTGAFHAPSRKYP